MALLQRLVSAYLDVAEDMALREIPMTMQDWEIWLNRFIEMTDREVLQDARKVYILKSNESLLSWHVRNIIDVWRPMKKSTVKESHSAS